MSVSYNGRTTVSGVDYLKGFEETIAALQTVKKTKAKAAIRKGTRAGSKIIQAAMKRLAPKRTGLMQRNIKVRALPRSRIWTGVITVIQEPCFYAAFGELGTKRQEATHWMQRAAAQVREQAIGEAIETIANELTK